jgi:colanic acid/amylovoran biosynthesis glycosyltransferase
VLEAIKNMSSSQTGRVMFVTTSTPFSEQAEVFVLDELDKYRELSTNFWVLPARRRERIPTSLAVKSGLIGHVVSPALFSMKIVWGALRMLYQRPVAVIQQIVNIFRNSGGLRNLVNNLVAFPKALWLAEFVQTNRVEHIHAYWLTHTATMAMVAAGLTKISWSATGYRWDIESNNHMQAKFATAAFLRCADELGQNDMIRLRTKYGTATRIVMVRTGVHLPDPNCWLQKPIDTNRFVCAGAFVLRKQQELLVRAFARHLLRHSAARLELIGDGPLRQRVANVVKELGIQYAVVFRGTMPLEQLRALLRERPISVLPSIVTDLAEQEGIPVVLIEAMANGSPIISTPTGSIRALVLEQCGLLVEPGSVESLATGMALLAAEPDIAAAWAIRAYARLGAEFDGKVCVRQLAELITSSHTKVAA